MRELTANYYANNDFTKVIGEIELATEELAQLVGSKVIELAESYYLNPEKEGTDTGIVRKVQRPIALLATLRLYQKNDLSHEDDGRKFKVATDGSEKLPWEWQLDRDDALHLEEYYKAVDVLIRYLNDKELMPLQSFLRDLLMSNKMSLNNMQGLDAAQAEAKMQLSQTLKYSAIIVSTVPVLCIYPFIQKYFVKGVMIGSVKG